MVDYSNLTDFGVVYYKLYYIAFKYYKHSKELNPNGVDYYEGGITESILTRKQKD